LQLFATNIHENIFELDYRAQIIFWSLTDVVTINLDLDSY